MTPSPSYPRQRLNSGTAKRVFFLLIVSALLLVVGAVFGVSGTAGADGLSDDADANALVLRQGSAGYRGYSNAILIGPPQVSVHVRQKGAILVSNHNGLLRRSLVRFDLRGQDIDPAKIAKVEVELVSAAVGSFSQPREVSVYPVAPGSADWSNDTVSWNSKRVVDGVAERRWNAPGLGTPGAEGNQDTLPRIASFDYAVDMGRFRFEVPVELVQSWINDPSTNGGFLMKSTDEGGEYFQNGFRGMSFPVIADRPALVIHMKP